MAYRTKAEAILQFNPDLLIIPECEHPDKLVFVDGLTTHSDILWYGQNANKGICIFAFGKYKLKLLEIHNPDIKVILPIEVTGGHLTLSSLQFGLIIPQIQAINILDRSGRQLRIMKSC